MVDLNDVLITPYILEHVLQDVDRLVPHEPVVLLLPGTSHIHDFIHRFEKQAERTSENAGAAILR